MIQGLGPEGSIEYNSMIAYLESQRSSGGQIEPPRDSKPSVSLRQRASELVKWVKGFVPPEPKEIVAPIEMVGNLEVAIVSANSAQLGHDFATQQQYDRRARALLEQTGLDQVYRLTPGVTGLQLAPKERFAGRLQVHSLPEREQVVIQIAPSITKR